MEPPPSVWAYSEQNAKAASMEMVVAWWGRAIEERAAGMGGGVRTLAHVHNFQIVVWVPFFSSKFMTSQKVSYKEQTPPFFIRRKLPK